MYKYPEQIPVLEDKKKEIHNIIDSYSTPEKNDMRISGRNTQTQLYHNKKQESYWNDWFGRPGFLTYKL